MVVHSEACGRIAVVGRAGGNWSRRGQHPSNVTRGKGWLPVPQPLCSASSPFNLVILGNEQHLPAWWVGWFASIQEEQWHPTKVLYTQGILPSLSASPSTAEFLKKGRELGNLRWTFTWSQDWWLSNRNKAQMGLQPINWDFQGGLMSIQTRRSRNKLALMYPSVTVLVLTCIFLPAASSWLRVKRDPQDNLDNCSGRTNTRTDKFRKISR